VEVLRSNSATDYSQLSGIAGVLGNAGNNGASSPVNTWNKDPAGTNGANAEYAYAFYWTGAPGALPPTPAQRAAMAALDLATYGVS
jgi:hypothetical protein